MTEFTILLPCLNEAKSLGFVIDEAAAEIARLGLDAEILVADNGSDDGSPDIAAEHGARVVHVAERGYGAALMGGMRAADSPYIIMGDADGSYDFSNLAPFVKALRGGAALVVGNRFQGGIERGALFPQGRSGFIAALVIEQAAQIIRRFGVLWIQCDSVF